MLTRLLEKIRFLPNERRFSINSSSPSYIIKLSIKLDTFPSKFRTAKKMILFKKELKIKLKKYRSISLFSLTSMVTEESIRNKSQDYFNEVKCLKFTNQASKQFPLQGNVTLSYWHNLKRCWKSKNIQVYLWSILKLLLTRQIISFH